MKGYGPAPAVTVSCKSSRAPSLEVGDDVDEASKAWMHYIDSEVRAACEHRGWASQVRRKWTSRERPVAESPLEDYEWKLIPESVGRLPDLEPSPMIDSGRYYVLWCACARARLVLQHDTEHLEPFLGPAWFISSFTEIHVGGLGGLQYALDVERQAALYAGGRLPPVPGRRGILRDILLELTGRFGPNWFALS